MSSVNFNSAATSALRSLQTSNRDLDATQSRISTGLRIGEAKDNAAYWSISTTLKSDNKALSSVSDALGLGGATVDVAYEGLNQAADVLDEIKKKIVAASGDAADKVALQGEIKELQKQLTAIASASSFSGENWLAIDSASASYSAEKTVVSSFNRDKSGAVTLDTIKIASGSFALTDASGTKEGILDANKVGNTAKNGLDNWTTTSSGAGAFVTPAGTFTATNTAGNFTADVTIGTLTKTVTFATTTNMSSSDFVTAFNLAATGQFGSNVVTMDSAYKLTTSAKGTAQTISINVSDAGGKGFTAAPTLTNGTAGVDAVLTSDAFGATSITMDASDTIDFSVTVDGAVKSITINKTTVDAALGTSDGVINSGANYAAVINKALALNSITGVKATSTGSAGAAVVVLTAAGASTLTATKASASKGDSILTLDVTTASRAKLTTYLNSLNSALSKVTSSASTLGAISKRIELQKDFVTTLMDTIDKGVSGLVDADMNEESTRLQALQVKQQLGVQALSIANQSAQNVLSLFRS